VSGYIKILEKSSVFLPLLEVSAEPGLKPCFYRALFCPIIFAMNKEKLLRAN